jgi:hypothetical protein
MSAVSLRCLYTLTMSCTCTCRYEYRTPVLNARHTIRQRRITASAIASFEETTPAVALSELHYESRTAAMLAFRGRGTSPRHSTPTSAASVAQTPLQRLALGHMCKSQVSLECTWLQICGTVGPCRLVQLLSWRSGRGRQIMRQVVAVVKYIGCLFVAFSFD